MHGCPSCLRPYLKGEGINQKKQNMVTTSFSPSFRRSQHCNGRCNHLGPVASFVRNQRLACKLVDVLLKVTLVKALRNFLLSTFLQWVFCFAPLMLLHCPINFIFMDGDLFPQHGSSHHKHALYKKAYLPSATQTHNLFTTSHLDRKNVSLKVQRGLNN